MCIIHSQLSQPRLYNSSENHSREKEQALYLNHWVRSTLAQQSTPQESSMIMLNQIKASLLLHWRFILSVLILNVFLFLVFAVINEEYTVFMINAILPLLYRSQQRTKGFFIWITTLLLIFGIGVNWYECIFSSTKSIVLLLILVLFFIHFNDVINEKEQGWKS